MPERPHAIGLPSLWDREHWDPIIEACVETETVISLHVGSSGGVRRARRARRACSSAPRCSASCRSRACAEWLWSEYPVQAPDPQDRDERRRHRLGRDAARPARQHRRPLRLRPRLGRSRPPTCCKRNFWFCTLDDPSTIDTRHRIGVENIMVEIDYPHGDSTWPDTQLVIEKRGATSRRRAAHDVLRERRRALPASAPRDCPAPMNDAQEKSS